MKKFVKMSLAAAVAVAGLSTSASAVALEDAVKDTTMTGYVRYRLNTNHTTSNNSAQSTEGKLVYNFKTKVNDAVTANVKFVGYYKDSDTGTATQADFNTNQANFIIKTDMATVIAGLQTTQSPFVANNGDTRSNGLTALIPAGPVTIAAAHYVDTLHSGANIAGLTNTENDVSAIAVLGSVEGVNFELWHADVSSSKVSTDAILLSANVGPVALSGHWAQGETGTAGEDIENIQIVASGKVGAASVYGAYATTGKTSGNVTLDGDTDSKLIFALEGSASTMAADADAFVIGASMPVGPVTVGIDYMDGDAGGVDFDETLFSVGYAMSKNFKLSGFYSTEDYLGTDGEISRVEAKYSF